VQEKGAASHQPHQACATHHLWLKMPDATAGGQGVVQRLTEAGRQVLESLGLCSTILVVSIACLVCARGQLGMVAGYLGSLCLVSESLS